MLKAVLLLLAAFIPASYQQCFTSNDTVPPLKLAQYAQYVQSHRRFSLSLLKSLNNDGTRKNILFSPYSIENVLMLAYFGAERETEAALAEVLQLQYSQTKKINYKAYNGHRKLVTSDDVASNLVTTADKIFFSTKVHLRRCMEEKFKKEIDYIDYQEEESAHKYIDDWIYKRTNGNIKGLVTHLSPTASATLVSVAHFKAKWLSRFDPSQTQRLPFYVNDKESIYTNMMVKTDYFNTGYNKELQTRFVVLPNQEMRTSMIILLPDNDLDTTINSMSEPLLSFVITRSFYRKSYLKVYVPKFENYTYVDLSTVFEKLGNTLTDSADFSGFTGRMNVFFNGMVHQSKIQVDEEGLTTAKPTDTVESNSTTQILPETFKCDRPFAYIIYDFFSRKILFMGTFREPKPQWE